MVGLCVITSVLVVMVMGVAVFSFLVGVRNMLTGVVFENKFGKMTSSEAMGFNKVRPGRLVGFGFVVTVVGFSVLFSEGGLASKVEEASLLNVIDSYVAGVEVMLAERGFEVTPVVSAEVSVIYENDEVLVKSLSSEGTEVFVSKTLVSGSTNEYVLDVFIR